MAKKKDYVPSRNGDKVPWATNLKAEIPTDGPTVGESTSDVTAVETAAQGVVDEVNNMKAAKTAYQSAMKTATDNMNGHIAVIRRHAQRMKTSPAYTPGIGENLGIEGDDHVVDVANSAPVLKISKVPSGYQIDFNLLNYFDGVHIYRKRPADAGFSYLATDTSSPYIDTDAMVDNTQYHAFFLLHDAEVGKVSAEVTVKL